MPGNSAGDLFGMVKTWPFKRRIVTSNGRGSKGQIESPGAWYYAVTLYFIVFHALWMFTMLFSCLPSLKLTAFAPENQWLEDHPASFWESLFSGANLLLVLGKGMSYHSRARMIFSGPEIKGVVVEVAGGWVAVGCWRHLPCCFKASSNMVKMYIHPGKFAAGT